MKILALTLVGVVFLLSGCAMVRVKTPVWQMSAGSLFKQIEIPKVDIGKDGSVHVESYRGTVAGAAIGEAVKAVTIIK